MLGNYEQILNSSEKEKRGNIKGPRAKKYSL